MDSNSGQRTVGGCGRVGVEDVFERELEEKWTDGRHAGVVGDAGERVPVPRKKRWEMEDGMGDGRWDGRWKMGW